jgi:signal transduction histidine kinase
MPICHSAQIVRSSEVQDRRFYRVDEARQRISGGRGLGLAIVKRLVELHDGRVWVTSELGTGSTFFVSIPR